jgi:hypothetical protein
MRTTSSYRGYSFASIALPLLSAGSIYVYQSITRAGFWASLDRTDDAARFAGAMMAVSQIGQMVVVVGIGCVLGMLCAIRGFQVGAGKTGLATVGAVINGLVLLIMLVAWVGA